MLILALDPGPSWCSWALVAGEAARVRFLEAGRVESNEPAFGLLVRSLTERHGALIDVVAVERVNGYVYDPVRGAQVVATSNVAGGLAWVSRSRGHEVIEVPAPTVRKVLLGKAKLGFRSKEGDVDRAIKAALPSYVDGMPNRTNEHVRDALALAVTANWMWLSSQRRSA